MIHIETKIHNYTFYIAKDSVGITYIDILTPVEKEFKESIKTTDLTQFKEVIQQLNEYLLGKRKEFTFKIHMIGTDFQKNVWNELLKIPYGTTTSYQTIAESLGDKNKVRAAANAIGKNPLLLVVPCHRILYKNKKLGGFSSGIENKQHFLELESLNK
ncbi:similar to methylated-DNA--protein-cysteine methyltransferase containing protein [Alteracholeplasma palmae J233]|uniref:methylated-DNA--[protein]-cysteine S-methyltransferase n=1 Tax=Alteracholeplasma palmae (strain ATCC 49389 / J233) TaxID=1318466 RepID=U4KRW3_ALTPJ|nr:methylated-DNA--[protein]-cysteine S-methyltransferase [Alteracholeplasma palmae]CCV64496.1 similar to methylated-DNA--protein-cysteine methyltransferase containing protein [Alteracholeplasma palmae J233]